MKTKLLLALMACMCVVSCKKDSDATNGADDSIYGVYDVVWYDGVDYRHDLLLVDGKPANEVEKHLRECAEKEIQGSRWTNCYTFDDVVKHYEGKLTDIELDDAVDEVLSEVKIIPIDKSNHTAKMIMKYREHKDEIDLRVFENTIIFVNVEHDDIHFEIKYKGGKPAKLYLMSEIINEKTPINAWGKVACGVTPTLKHKNFLGILLTKVREL